MSRSEAREDQVFPAGDIEVVVLRYPPPQNCWRVEIRSSSSDLDGDLGNLSSDEAEAIGDALIDASVYIRCRD